MKRINVADVWRIVQAMSASLMIAVVLWVFATPVILDTCQFCRDGSRSWLECFFLGCWLM